MAFGGNDWLALTVEPSLEPDLPICDPHHHFWDLRPASTPYQRYLMHELNADIYSGHNVRSTVFVEARSMYRADGPEELRPVGEVECQILQGDASNRTYFRTTFQKGAKPEVRGSVIVMQLQEAVPGPETDFTRILKFLQGLDLPVPDLYHYDVENGLLFLED